MNNNTTEDATSSLIRSIAVSVLAALFAGSIVGLVMMYARQQVVLSQLDAIHEAVLNLQIKDSSHDAEIKDLARQVSEVRAYLGYTSLGDRYGGKSQRGIREH